MEFYVNNEKIDVQLENEKTVGDVLKSFELTCNTYGYEAGNIFDVFGKSPAINLE